MLGISLRFVIHERAKSEFQLFYDFRGIDTTMKTVGGGGPPAEASVPTVIFQGHPILMLGLKCYFCFISLYPNDKEYFAFVPTLHNRQSVIQYHWRVLQRGIKITPLDVNIIYLKHLNQCRLNS